ncbi:Annexin D6 [Hibiscus syriacus]|uniref:Annexin D6 n=1 Tax=Hibiscus syriacus TaxID=106335 RepID=A0A6A3BMH1_HIBSY|nr:Annexin D6 [Hibiscus syriacus]
MATIDAPKQVSFQQDAEVLRKACKGWGTDEKAIISVLGNRNAAQRKQIRLAYEELYQEDLVKRLESELSGDFERAMYRWILDPADRDAVLANVAIKKLTPDHHVIVEIACTRSPEELLAVRRAYHNRYKHSLEEHVAAHTKGDTRMASPNQSYYDPLLVALVTAFRYDGEEINTRLANSEAGILHEALKDKKFNHEEVIRILTTRSKMQLMATFNRYRDDHGTSITKHLQGDSGDEFLKLLHTAVRCLNDPKKYFEKVLRNSIEGREPMRMRLPE